MARPPDLPDYDSPPVNEVVVGVQFQRMPITGAHIGLFWSSVRNDFPKIVEQPPLEPRVENLAYPAVSQTFLPFVFPLPGMRYWLSTQDDVELLQLQNDRLIFNWRKRTNDQAYPHFEYVRERFAIQLANWKGFLVSQGISPRISQWEITYVNRISSTDRPLVVEEVMSFLAPQLRLGLGGPSEVTSLTSQRVLSADGADWARGYVSANNGVDATGAPVVSFELTVRGPLPEGEEEDSALPRLQLKAREWIVRAFDHLTSVEMHKFWGKR